MQKEGGSTKLGRSRAEWNLREVYEKVVLVWLKRSTRGDDAPCVIVRNVACMTLLGRLRSWGARIEACVTLFERCGPWIAMEPLESVHRRGKVLLSRENRMSSFSF